MTLSFLNLGSYGTIVEGGHARFLYVSTVLGCGRGEMNSGYVGAVYGRTDFTFFWLAVGLFSMMFILLLPFVLLLRLGSCRTKIYIFMDTWVQHQYKK